MPVSMPFHLETGPTLLIVEDFLNGKDLKPPNAAPPGGAAQAHRNRLWNLRSALAPANPPPNSNGVLDAALATQFAPVEPILTTPMPAFGGLTPIQALHTYWLGSIANGEYDSESADPTKRGKWLNYQGRSEEILRRTFYEALSLSLRLSNATPGPNDTAPTTGTPVGFICMWKCAQPWLEGWVQSRTDPEAIVVTICTPSDGNFIDLKPNGSDPIPKPLRGSFVVTHERHIYWPGAAQSTSTTPPGSAPLPHFGGIFSGRVTQNAAAYRPVVTVSPAVNDGGVS